MAVRNRERTNLAQKDISPGDGAGAGAARARMPEQAILRSEASVAEREVEVFLRAEHGDPFAILGPHPMVLSGERFLSIRSFQPRASELTMVFSTGQPPCPASKLHPSGFFEAVVPYSEALVKRPGMYGFRIRDESGAEILIADPYSFPPLLTDFDLHLLGEGTHYNSYEKLGAHLQTIQSVRGVHFAVWAPNARRVSVVGNFNHWDGRVHRMRSRGTSGIWELFIPGVAEGMIYKYEILPQDGPPLPLKADPYGFGAELRPSSGSVVANLEDYAWNDVAWMGERARKNWLDAPISIYEVHLGSWQRVPEEGNRWLTYGELGDRLIPYVKQLGFTHIELLPVMEHPFDGSWGYQTLGYFAATSRFGAPRDFMQFVDRCHQAGLGVILDWTPAHFPRDEHGLGFFDGTHLYEHADPRQGSHPDWGTLVYNYGRNEVQNFLIGNALFWLDKYHLDGLRVDAVASMLYLDYSRKEGEWVPNELGGRENLAAIAFLKRLNEAVHGRHTGVLTIAEESTSWPMVSRPTYLGGLGFSLKWNMGWMNDTLQYFEKDPVYRKYEHNRMTFSMLYAFTENFTLPLSHDEVVHGKRSLLHKMPGDSWQQFANLRLLYGYQFAHPGKKLLFMGNELAQRTEWNHDASLDWHLLEFEPHRGVQRLLTDLNAFYAAEASLHEVDFDWQGFEWIDCQDADASVLSFIRRSRSAEDFLVIVANFTPVVRESHRVGVPEPGTYREVFNSDSEYYAGGNVGNLGSVQSVPEPCMGRPHSIQLVVPPLGIVYLKLDRQH
jgi:1,4-alpha-glucan branching enzyme